ncbi:hypothetical protein [Macrococcus capreoli]|uniref:hypothetical protein n=1 Tax=Macrococcus capreoli TaxID=2982690 RepID=UPI0021D5BF9B|nr:hypothetical protein [Macrococcus sp. TMW 2.2395]MCU7556548.1 hypothetical protein [Macrococcus sp. TMW 2.2395]
MKKELIKVDINDNKTEVIRIKDAADGCPRYLVHYAALGLTKYQFMHQLSKTGYKRYKGEHFTDCIVISCRYIETYLNEVYKRIKALQTPSIVTISANGLYVYHGRNSNRAKQIATATNGYVKELPPVLTGDRMEAV